MSFSDYEVSKTSSSCIWITPKEILSPLGEFDLDPCAAPEPRPWNTAKSMWATPAHDGLAEQWFGRVWLNPPYGRGIENWMEKMAVHGNGIAVTYARTETRWFHKYVFPFISGVFFFQGRQPFYRPDGTRGDAPTAPHVLLAYGEENARILSDLKLPGVFLPIKHVAN